MNLMNRVVLVSLLCLTPFASAEPGAQFDVKLSPAGSFIGKAKVVSGKAFRTEDGVSAENVVVDLKTVATGVSLRDKHTKDYLKVEEHPQAKLVKAHGKNGKGEAILEIRGKQIPVKGTYAVKGGNLVAQFPMALKDLDITGVRYMGVGVKDTIQVTIELPLEGGRGVASVKKKKASSK